ncbi:MAG: Nif3-like dinuclear metal center hexameric protein [Planctomycetota bacterium]
MIKLDQICNFLNEIAPLQLAEDWDNVGLLVGDRELEIRKVMTCLTITPESADEAIKQQVDLIVSHHPLPFRPVKRITVERTPNKLVWDLIRHNVCIYSPHTSFDSAPNGINQSVCDQLGLQSIKPLNPLPDENHALGSGRFGELESAVSFEKFIKQLKQQYSSDSIRVVSREKREVKKVASACGSGGSFLGSVIQKGCDTMITGEADFHTCLEAKAQNINLILVGHYNSERFAVEQLAELLSDQFHGIECWPSRKESDPIFCM